MKILVTGVKGQLGHDIFNYLNSNYDVDGIDFDDLDISNRKDVECYFSKNFYDCIIHCAAYTAVDIAEVDTENCYNVNVLGTRYLVAQAEKQKAKFIYFSTDYVFDGNLNSELTYDSTYETSPCNFYGLSKELGEHEVRNYKRHFILRISWVFGMKGRNFPKTMISLSKCHDEIKVITDQVGSPTYTKDVAENILQFVSSDKYDTYHFTNTGYTSWNEFAGYIFELTKVNTKVDDILTKDYKTNAIRPLNSKLNQKKLIQNGFKQLPSWENAIKRFLLEIGEI